MPAPRGGDDEATVLAAPFPGGITVIVARSAPAFHPLELSTFRRVHELVALMAPAHAIVLPV